MIRIDLFSICYKCDKALLDVQQHRRNWRVSCVKSDVCEHYLAYKKELINRE